MGESRDLLATAHEMKRDWNDRARENAKWFINTVKLEQSDEEFDETGRPEVEKQVLADLAILTGGRDPGGLKLLEIGCGIGRMTHHLAQVFGEVHATDVSGEMVAQARRRLGSLRNAHFHETSGVDFAALPDDYFDAAFSIYVFQHVPSVEVVRANIRDALRVLKPGGVFKFQTSGITSAAFAEMEKNTWTGVSFPEAESRRLSLEIGAQLVRLSGAETQYFWTTLRKPRARRSSPPTVSPRVVLFGRADDPQAKSIPTRGDYAYLTLIVAGLDRETADCNTVSAEIAGSEARPCYVGPPGENYAAALPAEAGGLIQVNLGIPASAPPGPAPVRLRLAGGESAEPVTVRLEEAPPSPPRINIVANDLDGGVDIYARGPKSLVRLFVEGLEGDLSQVRVWFGARPLAPRSIEFVPANAVHLVKVQLPEDTAAGETEVRISVGDLYSASIAVSIQSSDPR